jgi:hypothetical protein
MTALPRATKAGVGLVQVLRRWSCSTLAAAAIFLYGKREGKGERRRSWERERAEKGNPMGIKERRGLGLSRG